MAKISKLKNLEGETLYPVTVASAVKGLPSSIASNSIFKGTKDPSSNLTDWGDITEGDIYIDTESKISYIVNSIDEFHSTIDWMEITSKWRLDFQTGMIDVTDKLSWEILIPQREDTVFYADVPFDNPITNINVILPPFSEISSQPSGYSFGDRESTTYQLVTIESEENIESVTFTIFGDKLSKFPDSCKLYVPVEQYVVGGTSGNFEPIKEITNDISAIVLKETEKINVSNYATLKVNSWKNQSFIGASLTLYGYKDGARIATVYIETGDTKIDIISVNEYDEITFFVGYSGGSTNINYTLSNDVVRARSLYNELLDYIKKTDIATDKNPGIAKVSYIYGIRVLGNEMLSIARAENVDIDGLSNAYKPIVPSNLSYAVQKIVGDFSELSTDEKSNLVGAINEVSKSKESNDEEWEVLYRNTLEETENAILDFDDVNFDGKYKKIKIHITGSATGSGSNLNITRNNNSQTMVLFGTISATENRIIELSFYNNPRLHTSGERPAQIDLKAYTISTSMVAKDGCTSIAVPVEDIKSLKIAYSSHNFNSGCSVEVWGVRKDNEISFIVQPYDFVVIPGKTTHITTVATGTGISYLWQCSDDGEKWSTASDSGNTTITLACSGAYRFYRCKATDENGNVAYSKVAERTVGEIPDMEFDD